MALLWLVSDAQPQRRVQYSTRDLPRPWTKNTVLFPLAVLFGSSRARLSMIYKGPLCRYVIKEKGHCVTLSATKVVFRNSTLQYSREVVETAIDVEI